MAWSSCSKPPVSIAQWMPHSFGAFSSHHQRPARFGSPGWIARVQGAPPIEAELLDQVERLLREPARVDAEEADLRIDLVGHVEEGHPVVLEGGRDGDARREALQCPLEHGLGLLALERDRELARLELVEELDA